MKKFGFSLTFLLGSLAMPSNADVPANETNNPPPPSEDSPYKTIAERNPFGLKPLPPPTPPPQPVPEQLKSDLKLTGIMAYGARKAYFMATDPKTKTPEYFSLGVDERKDGVEVLSIDEGAKSVRIRQLGTETLMTFATHGVAAPAGPPPPPPTAPPGMPGIPGGAPGAMGGAMPNMPVTSGVPPIPTASSVRPLPSRTPRISTTGAATPGAAMSQRYGLTQPAVPENTMGSAEQVILMEVQRMADPNLPPTPGIPMPTDSPVPTPVNTRLPRLPGR